MRTMGRWVGSAALLLASFSARAEGTAGALAEKPLFREFMGLNGHTIQFKPLLYAPVCRAVRDYHPWSGTPAPTRVSRPRFRSRATAWTGGRSTATGKPPAMRRMFASCSMTGPQRPGRIFPGTPRAYGRAFAKAFGPSSGMKLVASAEVGNEPGNYDDESYRTLFESMAAGLRRATRNSRSAHAH